MRSTLIGFLVGCGLTAITAVSALACPYQSSATNDQASQQVAQTQNAPQTDSQ